MGFSYGIPENDILPSKIS